MKGKRAAKHEGGIAGAIKAAIAEPNCGGVTLTQFKEWLTRFMTQENACPPLTCKVDEATGWHYFFKPDGGLHSACGPEAMKAISKYSEKEG